MDSTLPGMAIVGSDVHRLNAAWEIPDTLDPKSIDESEEQPLNALSAMSVAPEKTSVLNEVHCLKASSAIVSQDVGIDIAVKSEQPANARLSIVFSPHPKVILDMLQPMNADLPIRVTLSGMDTVSTFWNELNA